MSVYEIRPVSRPIRGVITPPGSKSISNRALVCAAMATGDSRLIGLLDCDDTRVLRESLGRLGVRVFPDPVDPSVVTVHRPSDAWRPISRGLAKTPESAGPSQGATSGRATSGGGTGLTGTEDSPDLTDVCTELFVGNSGTTIRFLMAMLSAGRGRYRLDGVARMRQRPLGDLVSALRSLGVSVCGENGGDHERGVSGGEGICGKNDGDGGREYAPVLLDANGLRGGDVWIRGDVSSQFLSGLLMAAPYAVERPVGIRVTRNATGRVSLVSRPYVTMTLEVMRAFGVEVETDGELSQFVIPRTGYRGREYRIEPDASSASYFLAAAAITGGTVTIPGLSERSIQGDIRFAEVLERMGCRVQWTEGERGGCVTLSGPEPGTRLRGIDVEMSDISDTSQTLSVVAIFASGATRIRGVGNMRYKETDRIAAVATELRRLGVSVTEYEDGLRIEPRGDGMCDPPYGDRDGDGELCTGRNGGGRRGRSGRNGWDGRVGESDSVTIRTYDDHRMAMSFALAGLRIPGVRIADPECVSKTYPNYFEDLAGVCEEDG
ncbi:MAG: 3-phosphoshikimate 1-carboxyvinyltransferase [Planctomycetia bacterium]|nr:3-phosphoshikimate 1-carboxyvinyltransferase [Planctomycetia bacterium]